MFMNDSTFYTLNARIDVANGLGLKFVNPEVKKRYYEINRFSNFIYLNKILALPSAAYKIVTTALYIIKTMIYVPLSIGRNNLLLKKNIFVIFRRFENIFARFITLFNNRIGNKILYDSNGHILYYNCYYTLKKNSFIPPRRSTPPAPTPQPRNTSSSTSFNNFNTSSSNPRTTHRSNENIFEEIFGNRKSSRGIPKTSFNNRTSYTQTSNAFPFNEFFNASTNLKSSNQFPNNFSSKKTNTHSKPNIEENILSTSWVCPDDIKNFNSEIAKKIKLILETYHKNRDLLNKLFTPIDTSRMNRKQIEEAINNKKIVRQVLCKYIGISEFSTETEIKKGFAKKSLCTIIETSDPINDTALKKEYRKLSLILHPDRAQNNVSILELQTKSAAEAYSCLNSIWDNYNNPTNFILNK